MTRNGKHLAPDRRGHRVKSKNFLFFSVIGDGKGSATATSKVLGDGLGQGVVSRSSGRDIR